MAAVGWYPDEADANVTRYWDGTQWRHERVWDGAEWIDRAAEASSTAPVAPVPVAPVAVTPVPVAPVPVAPTSSAMLPAPMNSGGSPDHRKTGVPALPESPSRQARTRSGRSIVGRLPRSVRIVGVALMVLIAIPILSPIPTHFVDTIHLNSVAVHSAGDEIDKFQTLLRWAIYVTFWSAVLSAIGLFFRCAVVSTSRDGKRLRVGHRSWSVRRVDGVIQSSTKVNVGSESSGTVHTTGYVGSSGMMTGTSTVRGRTVQHYRDDFVVRDASGSTQGFFASDMDLNVAPGHDVTVIDIERGGKHQVLAVSNRTSGHIFKAPKRTTDRMIKGFPGTPLYLVVAAVASWGVTQLGDNKISVAITVAALIGIVGGIFLVRMNRRLLSRGINHLTR
jgi:Protein of unknown function (DUF2510)